MNAPGLSRREARNIAGFLAIALIWGSTWLVIKDQISQVPAAWTVTWRFMLAAMGMFAIVVLRREAVALPRAAIGFAAVTGLIHFTISYQLVYASEHYVTSGLVAVIFALMLIPNAALARLFIKTPVSGHFLAGSAVALVGIALLLLHEYRAAPAGKAVPLGIALAVGAVLCSSIGNVMQATERARRLPVSPFMAWAMAFGALGNAAYAWAAHGAPQFDPRPEYLWGIVYLALIGTVATFPLYSALLRDWGPGKAAYNGVLVPVVAMALSTLFEGYRWSQLAIFGSLLALAGLLIALSGRKAGG